MKILVTGGAGFIGSNLCTRLVNEGNTVTVVDNFSSPQSIKRINLLKRSGVKIVRADVTNRINTKDVDRIYHLAAQTSVGDSFKKTATDALTNILGTINALELARKNECQFVFASSSTVYGIAKTPTPESAPLNPISPYGISKMAGEKYIELYNRQYNLKTTIFRIFNVYGPCGWNGVIPDFIRKLKQNPKRLEILGDGKQRKDYIYIDDIVEAFVLAPVGTYNLGSGVNTSVLEIASKLANLIGLDNVELVTGSKNWPGDVLTTLADISKIKKAGWKPKTSFVDGLRKTVKWHAAAQKARIS